MDVTEIKHTIEGEWASIAPEIRPGSSKNIDGSLKPFFLTRHFTYQKGDKFRLTVVNLADAYGKFPLAQIDLRGQMHWQGAHPIAEGAQKVDFVADEAYDVTPLHQGFVDLLNQVASQGFEKWELNRPQSILRKAFAPFGLAEGQIFAEYDLVYVLNNMLFWGARNIDGRGFDTEENRPTNLQIPLIRKQ